jgi:hypothetical protein
MKRIRRISIELISREFNLSVTKPVVAAAEARPGNSAQDGRQVHENPHPWAECPVCASPWFALSADAGEQPALVQRALEKYGIHTQLSPASELLVCQRSFELQAGTVDAKNRVTQGSQLPGNDPSSRGRGDSNV